MNDNKDIISEEATKVFIQQYNQRMSKSEQESARQTRIINEKSNLLIPLRMMLKKLMDAGVVVSNHSEHEHGMHQKAYAPQPLQVWESESSPHFRPGGSLYLDDPAHLEIAVSNPVHQKEEGLFVIKCATPHPLEHLLRGPFYKAEDACYALAQFLSASTVRIDRPDLLD